jgi:hypothetical protein
MTVDTSGEWRDERLYVLKTIESLQEEQRRQLEAAAVMSRDKIVKANEDIQAAHNKIRVLEKSAETLKKSETSLKLKNWIITALLSGVVFALSELLKEFIHRVRLAP